VIVKAIRKDVQLMCQMKIIKRLALFLAICLFSGTVSFGAEPAEEEAPILASYNFDDGELPASFSSYYFRAVDGKVMAFGKWSKVSFSDIPKNCSIEFKIKPIENRIVPRFCVKLRDDAMFFYKNNSVVGKGDSDEFVLISASDNQQKGESFKSDTKLLKPGVESTLKYVANGNDYSLYLNGEQIISATYEPSGGELKSGIEFALMPEDNSVGIIELLLDDIEVRGKASKLDIPSDAMYAFNFEDGSLPGGFSASSYSIEGGELKVSGKACSFSFPGMAKDGSLEFRIKPIEGFVIPNFNMLIGNGSFSYTANYVQDSSWDDRFVVYNAETWGNFVANAWAVDTFFSEKQRGHKVKVVAEGDTHTLYIDDKEIMSAECPVTEVKEGYDITFTLTGKDQFENVGFYLDDIIVKGKPAGADIETDILHEYNFDDGLVPGTFDCAELVNEDGKLKSKGNGSGFSFSNIPKNSYVEFKISPSEGNVIPGFTSTFGNASFTYVANFVQDADWDDRLTMFDATTGVQKADSWATNSFFSNGENTVKYFTDGVTYSLYVNNKKLVSGDCPMTMPKGRYNFSFRAGNAGKVSNIGYCIDDVTVKAVIGNTETDKEAENKTARVLEDTWRTETDFKGVKYAGFDVELNVPEGKTVSSFWISIDGKDSKLINITPVEGEKIISIPVVMKYSGNVTAKDVEINVK